MGLVAHYKLDGNANDAFGKYNGTASNVTWVDGKLGQCGSFTGGNNRYIVSPTLDLRGNISFSCWCYPFANPPDNNIGGLVSNHNHLSTANFAMYHTSSGIIVHAGYTDNTRATGIAVTEAIPLNQWTHIAFSYDNTTNRGKIFYNGILKVDSSFPKEVKFLPYPVVIGNWAASYLNNYGFDGLIDDVRIYDHALSEREVRDLALGKLLHYSFDQFQEPTENIFQGDGGFDSCSGTHTGDVSNSNNISTPLGGGWTSSTHYNDVVISVVDIGNKKVVRHTTGTTSGWNGTVSGSNCFMQAGKAYTASVWIRTSGANPPNPYGFYGPTGYRYSMLRGSEVHTPGKWIRYSCTMTPDIDVTGSVYLYGIESSTPGQYTEFWGYQLEQKSYATPFVNGTRTGTVKDQSTQGNDAPLTLANTPKWVEGGVVGNGCYEFDGVNDEVSAASSCGNVSGDKASFCAWVYHRQRAPTYSTIIHKSMQYTISVCSSTGGLTYSDSTAWSYASFGCHGLVPLNEWTHIVAVRNGSFVTLYINGTAVVTKTAGRVINTTSNPLFIGAYKDTAYANQFWNGQIDDVRIYATALTADQVKEIYQQRASLDSRGNLLC